MIIKSALAGMLDSNCYIIEDGGEAAVIDPGADHGEIKQVLDEHGLSLKYIIYTHGHIDHVCEGDALRRLTGARVVAHEDEARILEDPLLNGSALFWTARKMDSPDISVKDGDVLKLGSVELGIMHTPGHTPGGICLLARDAGDRGRTGKHSTNCVFTGDTLFRLSIGRTDLGAGDSRVLMASLDRLMELDDDVVVYPGHGPATTIGFERENNPWL
ncbi:MAG: MBL fold metallo-hydrolase [Clostridiaceae bacterium]|jgi:glyoxylase-like metal-dependent hydrolase (beta-lactamase superfamily II)|nr:MBL fold metallo-hydrolase [Clostridiaceae bacterium]